MQKISGIKRIEASMQSLLLASDRELTGEYIIATTNSKNLKEIPHDYLAKRVSETTTDILFKKSSDSHSEFLSYIVSFFSIASGEQITFKLIEMPNKISVVTYFFWRNQIEKNSIVFSKNKEELILRLDSSQALDIAMKKIFG